MTYDECLSYLFSRLPMFQRVGASAYRADLGNTHALMKHLNHPEENLKCIHIAGTNGKGSVSHMLASTLQESGYKTGLYTSPHLRDFRERIRINGQMIPRSEVIQFVERYRRTFDSIGLSFFEWTVGLAFEYFRTQKVDIAVIEVGMGGRLDATNVLIPELSVITNISEDHTQFLGETIPEIAAEKAGIIKESIPVLIGEYQKETEDVFRLVASQRKSELTFAKDLEIHTQNFSIPMKGNYQNKNLRTVLAAVQLLRKRGLNIPETCLKRGLERTLENTGLMGRWQLLGKQPFVVADTAHNSAGLQEVMNQIAETPYENLHIVWGMVSDKDREKIWPILPQKAQWYFCQPAIPRALDVRKLQAEAFQFGHKGQIYPSVNEAFVAAKANAQAEDMIFVGGSTFVVAEVV